MIYSDTSRLGRPLAKDPHVVFFEGRYLMYYSIPPMEGVTTDSLRRGWGMGIAESHDLVEWTRIGEILPAADYEMNGLCAPGALVRDGKVHLFYQTYGNDSKDAICHAYSADGIDFIRNETNPIFHPTGDWNMGRAIDAEVIEFQERYFLYFATRTPDNQKQIQGVAVAPATSDFNREDWVLGRDEAILAPELDWETRCIEAASVVERNGKLYMFYAGGYNNDPQQVGVAVSDDGLYWKRLSNEPFLKNGAPGEWNSSESGHPHLFTAPDGRTYLFFQGNNENGRTWYLSQTEVFWNAEGPYLKD